MGLEPTPIYFRAVRESARAGVAWPAHRGKHRSWNNDTSLQPPVG